MILQESHTVAQLEKRIRLSDYLPGVFKTANSRNAIKKAIKQGLVYIDGRVGATGDYLLGGELIELFVPDAGTDRPVLEMALEVIYEDDFLAIINKPAGIEVSGNKHRVLMNALPYNLKASRAKDALKQPKPVHRLDYPTSGVLLVGKTVLSVERLSRLFEDREIRKVYHAITIGMAAETDIIETMMDAKFAITEFRVLHSISSARFTRLNLTELIPHTGRRHQLRKHMAGIGTPILGDIEYGREGLILKGKGLYLHASRLEFIHPMTGKEISVSCPLPAKFGKLFPDISPTDSAD